MPDTNHRSLWGRIRSRRRSRGQSLVEFALVLPLILMLVMIAADFGRAYLGWINLNNAARVAVDFASRNPTAWESGTTPSTADQQMRDRYLARVIAESSRSNCSVADANGDGIQDDYPAPTFPDGYSVGDRVIVNFTCEFRLITPILSDVLGSAVTLGASAEYPIRKGAIAGIPTTGGGNPSNPATASFIASTTEIQVGQTITFDGSASGNSPASWIWNFGDGTTVTETTPITTHVYATDDTFTVTLTTRNAGGDSVPPAQLVITVTPAPLSGPTAAFSATPLTGNAPLTVRFTDLSIPDTDTTIVKWVWNFGSGGEPATYEAPADWTYTYSQGAYYVTLTVTDSKGSTHTSNQTLISVDARVCTVRDFAGVYKDAATSLWTSDGFKASNIQFDQPAKGGPANYQIVTQSLVGGTVDPQPQGCDSHIRVGP